MTPIKLKIDQKNQLLWVLSAATFLIFFQAFMVAPLIPRLADVFQVSVETIGLIVPAYLVPYAIATLVYGPLSDRLGRMSIIFGSLFALILFTVLTAVAWSAMSMLSFRLLTGLGASGVVPIALALIGDQFPYNERGRALGWLFGSMAGGMAFGSAAGVVLEPFITWQGLFLGIAALSAVVFVALLPYKSLLGSHASSSTPVVFKKLIIAWGALLRTKRGARTYGYVFFNGIFHSGVFTWLGYYFAQRYGLDEVGIGLALLGYGIPGLLFGPAIGRLADRWGRSQLIPAGLAIAGLSATSLALPMSIIVAKLFVITLSLGYDMTQPLLAGIVTDLSPKRGLAMGLNVFFLFLGFGIGSLVFSGVLQLGFNVALVVFGGFALLVAMPAVSLFRSERPRV